ncbi:MAG: septum formation protein Maf [Proteobacteria bacterium]|nr:septum formation protein Maf [Pseudomonadota bacterium]
MYYNSQQIILASASPRRQQYLKDMGLRFSVYTSAIDERPVADEDPVTFVIRMAREKAAAIRESFPDSWIVSGDTVVCLGQRILGKPTGAEDAVDQLMALSGREHCVQTGFCVTHSRRRVEVARSVTTKVRFAPFSEVTARAYVAIGESSDKAGAYAIQGVGACLVQSIEGSYSNVVGLPLCELLQVLQEHGVIEPASSMSE